MNNDLDRRFLLGGLAGAAGISALAALSKAGPLDPPAGAVVGTAKPLAELEPRIAVNAVNTPPGPTSLFRITQPGSYYLTGNIQGVAGKNGIEIATGTGGGGGGGAPRPGVTLDLCGFTVAGAAGTGDGIYGGGAVVSGVHVLNGFVRNWAASGVTFFSGATNIRISGVVSSGNTGTGIFVDNHATITDCEALGNTGAGIIVNQSGLIQRCSSIGNGTGITTIEGAIIRDCLVRQNGGSGIVSTALAHISGCSVLDNTGDGIVVNNRNRVVHNLVSRNGTGGGGTAGAGIRMVPTSAGFNHIEGNTVSLGGRGYHAESIRNYFIRNFAEGNTTNWIVLSGNFALIMQGVDTDVPVNGNEGGTPISGGVYEPNANFTLV